MFQTNRIYKNNMLISVFILFCLQTLHIRSETISYSLEDAIFDVTTIYRITNMSNIDNRVGFRSDSFLTTYNGSYTIEIYTGTKGVGILIQNEKYKFVQTNVKELFNIKSIESFENSSHLSMNFNSKVWRVKTIFPNGTKCLDQRVNSLEADYVTTTTSYYNIISRNNTDIIFNSCFNFFQYRFHYACYNYINCYYNHEIFSLQWTPDLDHKCLSITYINRLELKFNIFIKILNENNVLMSQVTLENYKDVKILKITDIDFMKNQTYILKFEIPRGNNINGYSSSYDRDDVYFGLHRIAHCSNYGEKVRTVPINYMESKSYPKPIKIFGDYSIPEDRNPGLCLNNGYIINTSNTKEMCICPPGFSGKYCETGCGMNSYGTDCNEVCSIDNTMCRGMLMCREYECSCLAGLTGALCNEDCESGTYGSDCRQTCSENCQNNTCDQYTGVCLNGCSPGYILPHCIKKYPYLANAPTTISIEYEAIEFELDFQSHNIKGGDESIHVKYYQLFYKSLSEDNFSYSELKLINHDNADNRTTEILDGLQPKTKYLVGVILITDDGNQNDQDIVYGEYMTSCIQPQTIDYNVKLITGEKSIYVTWDKINTNRIECNVDEYVLTLQLSLSNQSYRIVNYAQEIIANSDNGQLIDNLLPGFQYDIKLTPKTINGPLLSSPTYSTTILIRGNYVSVKNLTLKNEEGKIKVNWKLINLHENTVNEPLKCTIKYKIVKILSCSMGKIERNWTSIKVFSQTKYEIFDVIPNSQYTVQVLIDDKDTSTVPHHDMAYILTPHTYPKTEPILDNKHPIYITNNSVSVWWKMDPENCSRLNGFFTKFYLKLKDKDGTMLQTKETKQKYIFFDGLKSNTVYELKVFIKTNVGYNSEHFLFVNFTTKYDDLMPVEDLMVYKKSLKNRMAGFRWSYPVNTNIDGFIVSFNNTASVIPVERCSAWSQHYCHTFYNLSPSNTYTFKIMPRSPDYPEGGKVSSISFNSIDGLPDPPMNLITTEVGSTYVKLQWDIPWIFNGMIKMFNINAEEISAIDMNTCCVSITPIEIPVDEELPTYKYTLTDLRPGSTYSIGVLTVSKSLWYSSLARISIETLH